MPPVLLSALRESGHEALHLEECGQAQADECVRLAWELRCNIEALKRPVGTQLRDGRYTRPDPLPRQIALERWKLLEMAQRALAPLAAAAPLLQPSEDDQQQDADADLPAGTPLRAVAAVVDCLAGTPL